MSKLVYLAALPLLFPVSAFTNSDNNETDVVANINLNALIKQCEDCHGTDQVPPQSGTPSLSGLSIESMQEAMAQFYYYERHCSTRTPRSAGNSESGSTSMCNVASTLSDEEVLKLAEYFNKK